MTLRHLRRRVFAYLRLTSDPLGEKTGYARQRAEISASRWADEHEIVGWYQDRDITAADWAKPRPNYEAMLAAIQRGEADGVIVWKMDRLTRLTREFERCWGIITDSSPNPIIIAVDDGIDTSQNMGEMFVRMKMLVAQEEVNNMRARAQSFQRERAAKGLPSNGGPRPFGLSRTWAEIVEHEAELVREAAQRCLAGESWRGICRDWSARGIRTTSGNPWEPTALMRAITGRHMAGLRDYKGQLIEGVWPAVLDRETHDALQFLKKPKVKRGRPYAYLLSGELLRCGRCGSKMYGKSRRKTGGSCAYICRGAALECGALSVLMDRTDEVVTNYILSVCERSDMLDALRESTEAQQGQLLVKVQELDAAKAHLSGMLDLMEQQVITPGQFQERSRTVREKIDALERVVQQYQDETSSPAQALAGVTVDELRPYWDSQTLEWRRRFLAMLCKRIAILPPERRGVFDPSRVEITLQDDVIRALGEHEPRETSAQLVSQDS